jgi:fatty-acyl-CoA synthase
MTGNSTAGHELQRDEQVKGLLGSCPRIVDLIGKGARIDPSAEAVIYLRAATDCNPVVYCFDEMMGFVKAAERWFRGNGIGPGDTVAILVPSGPATIVAIWGAAACGIAEPLNLLFTREAIVAQLNAVKARILLTQQPGMPGGLFEKVAGIEKEVPSLRKIVVVPLDGSIAFDGEILLPDPSWRGDYGICADAAEADRVAVMLPTGGTTGHPKVARLTNRGMVASAISSRMALDYRKGDRVMNALPLFHVGGLFVTAAGALSAGATTIVPTPFGARDPELIANFWTIIERYRITHGGNVPTVLGAISNVAVGDADISSLRTVPTGASVCPPEIERRFLSTWGGRFLQQIYGMTEVAGAIAQDFVGTAPKAGCVGTRSPLFEIAVLAYGRIHRGPWPSPIGELIVRGPQVFAGYVDKKQTEEAFHRGWLRSGDLSRIDVDGFVEIMGRVKDVIIRGGHNIDPRTIEDAALEFPGVALAAAVGRPDIRAGEVPMLFVTAWPGASINQIALTDFVQERILEPPARPRVVAVLAEMPVTPVGKIFKPKLREIATQEAARALLESEGLSDAAHVDAITDWERGLYLRVTADKKVAANVQRLLQQFPVRIEITDRLIR